MEKSSYSDMRFTKIKSAISKYENDLTLYLDSCAKYMAENNLSGKVPVENSEELLFLNNMKDSSYKKAIEEIENFVKNNK